ncbi:hypothetical protein P3T76_016154 [Phytophthora citrophthora]|uniref:DUF659 domain-containing protein n=1 Tax=Phytophthora citrophthora TaxID=4793 RepID=A0AAD9FY32_9STRA|nr:hypothetical protein P3T76_016154 [Phytophthora citrophthora]
MVRTNVFETLMSSAPSVDPLRVDINSYLSKLDVKNGRCRVCGNKVPWTRDRVTSHKTSRNCVGQSDDEAILFRSLKQMKVNAEVAMIVGIKRPAESISLPKGQHPAAEREALEDKHPVAERATLLRLQPATSFVDRVTVSETARIDAALANLVFQTGMSFRIVDSQAMKDFARALRPAYADRMPSARSIAGKFLNSAHSELMERVLNAVNTAKWFSFISDGWSNDRNEHFVNYVVIVPGFKPFFLMSVSISGALQTSKNIATGILEIVEKLGAERCLAVVMDNAPSAARGDNRGEVSNHLCQQM